MRQYHEVLRQVLDSGEVSYNRTGTPAKRVFGTRMEFDLTKGFPMVTTKKISFKNIAAELLWFLSGSTNIKDLHVNGVHIWDAWADEHGDLGPIYGAQWTRWGSEEGPGINQIRNILITLILDKSDRRLVLSAWNARDLPHRSKSPQDNVRAGKQALAPCHVLAQFSVYKGRLDCQVYQRSADLFLGVPYNIASYALLTHLMALESHLVAGRLIWVGGDTHIYMNHMEQVHELLSRDPYELPSLVLPKTPKGIFSYTLKDMSLNGYEAHPGLLGEVAV